jgi:hypothetical protein
LIPYQDFLEQVIQKICTDLTVAISKLNRPSLPNIKQEISAQIDHHRSIISQLDELVIQGILDEDTALLRAYKLKAEISQLEQQISALPPVNLQSLAQTISLPQFWLDLSESERRFYFREFIKVINIDRGEDQQWQIAIEFVF